jgi:hypothetical protein
VLLLLLLQSQNWIHVQNGRGRQDLAVWHNGMVANGPNQFTVAGQFPVLQNGNVWIIEYRTIVKFVVVSGIVVVGKGKVEGRCYLTVIGQRTRQHKGPYCQQKSPANQALMAAVAVVKEATRQIWILSCLSFLVLHHSRQFFCLDFVRLSSFTSRAGLFSMLDPSDCPCRFLPLLDIVMKRLWPAGHGADSADAGA